MGPKRLRVASPGPSGAQRKLDWSKCCICQTGDGELICPAQNKDEKLRHAGYKSLATNILSFHSIGVLPVNIDIAVLSEEDGLENTFISRSTKWHKLCYLQFNKTKLDRARKRLRESDGEVPSGSVASVAAESSRSTRSSVLQQDERSICFLCKLGPTRKLPLFCIATKIDEKLQECANAIGDIDLITFLSDSDLVAKEAKYHAKCLAGLYNKCRAIKNSEKSDSSLLCESIAFASVAGFISEKLRCENVEYIFKMSTLSSIYREKLIDILGADPSTYPEIHSSRLRERIIAQFPELFAEISGREYILRRQRANLFSDIGTDDMDSDAVAFLRFVKALRQDISNTSVSFNGHFSSNCQETSVPQSLLAIVNLIIYGTSNVPNCRATQPALTISQLIMHNYAEGAPAGNIVRNKRTKETPLPLYLGLSTYGRTRSKYAVNEMHDFGVSISSSRVSEITTALCHVVNERAKAESLVCPGNLKHGLFTLGAYDNIDYNPSSVTSVGSFHGTGLSVFQTPTGGDLGIPREFVTNENYFSGKDTTVPELPDSYAVVKNVILPSKEPQISKCASQVAELMFSTEVINWQFEEGWLAHVNASLKEEISENLDLSWAAFHARRLDGIAIDVSIGSLLPLFHEDSSSVSMVRHGMDVVKSITNFLHPGQVPVIYMDQPLYTLSKLIQWNWPTLYGESQYVTMFAPFHIEQAFLRVLGQLLDSCGWTSVVVNSRITSETGAIGYLKVTHVTKARYIHQVTASALYSLLLEAYNNRTSKDQTFDQWVEQQASESPTFKFWHLVLCLEIVLLAFVRSLREGNYRLFRTTLKNMLPWFFLFDHHRYAKWLTIHVKDLEELPTYAPSIHDQFSAGNFVICKSSKPFSALTVDQAYE